MVQLDFRKKKPGAWITKFHFLLSEPLWSVTYADVRVLSISPQGVNSQQEHTSARPLQGRGGTQQSVSSHFLQTPRLVHVGTPGAQDSGISLKVTLANLNTVSMLM